MKEALLSEIRLLLVFKEILDVVVVYDFFFKGITACNRRFNHFNNLGEFFPLTGFECCYNFLCHGLWFLMLDYLISL